MKTSKFFAMNTEPGQQFLVRVEAETHHEEDAAVAVAALITGPIIKCREVTGVEASPMQIMGVTLVDTELQAD